MRLTLYLFLFSTEYIFNFLECSRWHQNTWLKSYRRSFVHFFFLYSTDSLSAFLVFGMGGKRKNEENIAPRPQKALRMNTLGGKFELFF